MSRAEDGTITEERVAEPQFFVPESFKEKTYMKGVDSHEKLFSAFDGLQTKLGERVPGVPTDDAGDDAWNEYYKTGGKPETATEYKFFETKLPEGQEVNTEVQGELKGLLHKAGISQKQAMVLSEGYDQIMMKAMEAAGTKANAAQDADFDKLADTVFGDKKEKVLESSKKIINTFLPKDETLKKAVANLSNENLIVMASVLENVREKYIKEDDLGARSPEGGGDSMEDRRKRAREIMASEAYTNGMHPNHDNALAEVKELYSPLQRK